MENNMEKNYLKPEIVEEKTLERKLVYAEAETKRDGCSTILGSIDQDNKLS
jgi:hypothetical protein